MGDVVGKTGKPVLFLQFDDALFVQQFPERAEQAGIAQMFGQKMGAAAIGEAEKMQRFFESRAASGKGWCREQTLYCLAVDGLVFAEFRLHVFFVFSMEPDWGQSSDGTMSATPGTGAIRMTYNIFFGIARGCEVPGRAID